MAQFSEWTDTDEEKLTRIREFFRPKQKPPGNVLHELLGMFAIANGGRAVPMVRLYPNSPVGEFDNVVPYLWAKLDEFVLSLGNSTLCEINELYGMDGSD